ncbi:MAG: SagB/ThcOx family dehydrogenase, partial [Burkholderiales bacterium]
AASAPPPSRAPKFDLPAATIARRRRSAVDFDGATAIDAEAFYAMLEPLVPRAGVPPWDAWPHAPRVHLALFVHRVVGLEPGLYVFARDPEAIARLRPAMSDEWTWQKTGPRDLALHLLTAGDARPAARTVSCHQDIAADSCFALAMLADFGLARRAPWRYRELHWECGIIGQVLYLEAEAAGIRATGIGCFFDDALHRVLGLRGGEWQTLYHFTAGGAVDDERLTTLPPYAFPPRARVHREV